jgi:hypothetical protein
MIESALVLAAAQYVATRAATSPMLNARWPAFARPLRYRKVGGIRFLRIGRLQFSFCLCRH